MSACGRPICIEGMGGGEGGTQRWKKPASTLGTNGTVGTWSVRSSK